MNIYTIYQITNIVNQKMYIGFTSTNISTRWSSHVYMSKKSKEGLHGAIRKYGKNSFTIQAIYQSKDKNHTLNIMEPFFINLYNTYLGEGYNRTPGGEGCPHSLETIEKIRIKALQRETSYPAWNKGVAHSDQTIQTISAGVQKSLSDLSPQDRKEKWGRNGKKNAFFGKSHSESSKRRISEFRKLTGIAAGKNNPMYGKSAIKGRKWFNNGTDNVLIFPDDPILSDKSWVAGRLYQKKL